MGYFDENTQLLNSFLNRTFFASWRKPREYADNFSRMEIELVPMCNLGCKYCYYHRYGRDLYPVEIRNPDTILANLRTLLRWLIENRFTPQIDLFSGELLSQKIGYEALNIMADFWEQVPLELRPNHVCIPTNYTFLLDEKLTARVEEFIERFQKLGIRLFLSASVDGKYQETNRPFITRATGPFLVGAEKETEPRDDEYYDRMFAFNAKYGFGFHPMVYSQGIDRWIDNFLWFQENFRKYKISPNSVYLLEVRNEEWTPEQCAELTRFVEFLILWTWNNVAGRNRERMFDFITRGRGYNMLSSFVSTVGRGLGCSLQSMLYVRLGDLAIVPCHRTSYQGMEIGWFKKEGDRITGIEAGNVEFGIGEITFEGKTAPMCEACLLREFCSQGCLGSQYESTGDFLAPIPSVCQMEHAKWLGFVRGFQKVGILYYIIARSSPQKARMHRELLRIMEGGKW